MGCASALARVSAKPIAGSASRMPSGIGERAVKSVIANCMREILTVASSAVIW